jgi:transposase
LRYLEERVIVVGNQEGSPMKTLPVEFRHRVIALTEEGLTASEIAEILDVSGTWVRSIKKIHKSGLPLEPKSRANKRRSLAQREGERIRAQIKAKPGTTLEDLKSELNLKTSVSNLWYALKELKHSLKKKRFTPPSKTGPMSSSTAPSGKSSPPESIPVASCSSTKPSATPR